ncbi:hypothetical protein ASG43_17515 [Aureimonas sp. Leaf454]|nr:hypothetical protein ASG43_17515 [Aureimonas sp. Leaf454]
MFLAYPAGGSGWHFQPDAMREIGPLGVEWGGRTYWSEDLPALPEDMLIPEKFEVRSDPSAPEAVELWDLFRRLWIPLACRLE